MDYTAVRCRNIIVVCRLQNIIKNYKNIIRKELFQLKTELKYWIFFTFHTSLKYAANRILHTHCFGEWGYFCRSESLSYCVMSGGGSQATTLHLLLGSDQPCWTCPRGFQNHSWSQTFKAEQWMKVELIHEHSWKGKFDDNLAFFIFPRKGWSFLLLTPPETNRINWVK